MGFIALRAAAFYDVILGAENPGVEVVEYERPGAGMREIWIKRTSDEAPENPPSDIERTLPDVDRLLVRVGRDESHVKGGIAAPLRGDTILRAGDTRPYAFTGRIMGATAHSHTLEFTRTATLAVGSNLRG